MDERRCRNCRTRFTPLRNPGQHYCAKSTCQLKRRSRWHQKRLKESTDYQETHQTSQQKWLQKHPDYWQVYRLEHPAYVAANRKAQGLRNRKRRSKHGMTEGCHVIAKMYALFPRNPYLSYNYNCFLGEGSLIAKMYLIGSATSGVIG